MAHYDNRTNPERRNDQRNARTNAQTLAWAKTMLERFPSRRDLEQLITQFSNDS
jgi:hypothetical protein